MKSKRIVWMLIGCVLPLLFIFLAPALGLGENVGLLFFILAMFACHLLMPHGHGGKHQHESPNYLSAPKEDSHEKHSH
ncbi:hypothetical protein [Flavilitoribacter nigricans]|uniref:hypothetical protein n=1 Tax=Flavilitoribacter nigricans TaxID=70997 RepID=UPI00117B9816|nr:hypothetical protein [Flavilitoribacter nigricans]